MERLEPIFHGTWIFGRLVLHDAGDSRFWELVNRLEGAQAAGERPELSAAERTYLREVVNNPANRL